MAAPITVSCLLVMGCSNAVRCQVAEQQLVQMGFECRPMTEGAGSCMRTFLRQHEGGAANELIDEACRDLERAIPFEAHDWKAFIEVNSPERAWATFQAGKSVLRGKHPFPRRGADLTALVSTRKSTR